MQEAPWIKSGLASQAAASQVQPIWTFSQKEPSRTHRFTAVCDTDPEKRDWARSKLLGSMISDNTDDIPDPELAVLIATSHYSQPALAIKAIERGLHALIEKPAGVYTNQVREMNSVAQKHPGLVFTIMQNQRTDCNYKKIKELLDSGKLGALKRVIWEITDWYRPEIYYSGWRGTWEKDGGGVLLDQSPHQAGLLVWLCGMPKTVRFLPRRQMAQHGS